MTKNTPTVEANKKATPAAPRIARVAPHTDIFENDKEFLVIADLPGVESDGVQVELKDGELHMTAPQKAPEGLAGFEPVQYARSFWIPEFVDASGVSAELTSGVVRLHLPKHEQARPRRITVKAG